eukprot:UN11295
MIPTHCFLSYVHEAPTEISDVALLQPTLLSQSPKIED